MTGSAENPPPPRPEERNQRARSLPNAGSFKVAVFFSVLQILGSCVTIAALARYAINPDIATLPAIILGGIAVSVLSLCISFFKRRSAKCPLCKGTPLINSGAGTHADAKRIPPFSHGVSAILSILATHRFRCMYCSTDFDLFKQPGRSQRGTSDTTGSHTVRNQDKRN